MKNLKRLVNDAAEIYGPGSGWEEELGEVIVGAREELSRYDEAAELVEELLEDFEPNAGNPPFEEGTYGHYLQTKALAFLAAVRSQREEGSK